MEVNRTIIDQHEQKFFLSCIPSSIEMILKLEGKVELDYYDLQLQWGDKKGSFECFDKQTVKDLTFLRKQHTSDEISNIIDGELNENRYIVISVPNSVNGFSGCHMWIIYDKEGQDYKMFAKWFKPLFCIHNNVNEFVNHLNKRNITNDLTKEFEDHCIRLCNACIFEDDVFMTRDQMWTINNSNKDYVIVRQGYKLKVCDLGNTKTNPLILSNCVNDKNDKIDILIYEKAC